MLGRGLRRFDDILVIFGRLLLLGGGRVRAFRLHFHGFLVDLSN